MTRGLIVDQDEWLRAVTSETRSIAEAALRMRAAASRDPESQWNCERIRARIALMEAMVAQWDPGALEPRP